MKNNTFMGSLQVHHIIQQVSHIDTVYHLSHMKQFGHDEQDVAYLLWDLFFMVFFGQ